MRKFLILIIAAMMFISCSNTANIDSNTEININVELKFYIQTPVNSSRAAYSQSDIDYYKVVVSSAEYTKRSFAEPGDRVEIPVPKSGTYEISMEGISSEDTKVAEGSKSCDISEDNNNRVIEVPMSYLEIEEHTEVETPVDDEDETPKLDEFIPAVVETNYFISNLKSSDWELNDSTAGEFIAEYNDFTVDEKHTNNERYANSRSFGRVMVSSYISHDMWHNYAITTLHGNDTWYKFISIGDESKFPLSDTRIDRSANTIFANSEGEVYSFGCNAKVYRAYNIPENSNIDDYMKVHNDIYKYGSYYVQLNNFGTAKNGIKIDTSYKYIVQCDDGWYLLDFSKIDSIEE